MRVCVSRRCYLRSCVPYAVCLPRQKMDTHKNGVDDDRVRFHYNSAMKHVLIHVSKWNQSCFFGCCCCCLNNIEPVGTWIKQWIWSDSWLSIFLFFCHSFPPILHRPLSLTRQQRHLYLTDKQDIDFFFFCCCLGIKSNTLSRADKNEQTRCWCFFIGL